MELHNDNLLHLLWHSKFRVKYLHHWFCNVLLVSSLLSGWASMPTANREKPLPHKLCDFTSSLCACCPSSASIECIFSIWFGMFQNQKKFRCREGRKLVKIYRLCWAQENNLWNQAPRISLLFVLFDWKSVLILFFTSEQIFQRKIKGFLVSFIVFFKWAFFTVFFGSGFFTTTLAWTAL